MPTFTLPRRVIPRHKGLRDLLESFQRGILPDLDYQLRGTILEYLYPGEVTPAGGMAVRCES